MSNSEGTDDRWLRLVAGETPLSDDEALIRETEAVRRALARHAEDLEARIPELGPHFREKLLFRSRSSRWETLARWPAPAWAAAASVTVVVGWLVWSIASQDPFSHRSPAVPRTLPGMAERAPATALEYRTRPTSPEAGTRTVPRAIPELAMTNQAQIRLRPPMSVRSLVEQLSDLGVEPSVESMPDGSVQIHFVATRAAANYLRNEFQAALETGPATVIVESPHSPADELQPTP